VWRETTAEGGRRYTAIARVLTFALHTERDSRGTRPLPSATAKQEMRYRITLLVLTLFIALRADAAMVRVTGIASGRSIVVERNGKSETIALAGVAIVDEISARAMLQWTLLNTWVSLEARPGGYLVYRSPDALFVNRELVTHGFARATLPEIPPHQHVVITYLGTLHPMPKGAAASMEPKPSTGRVRGTGSGTSPRSPARPARRGRR
jgi:hypothetical protein